MDLIGAAAIALSTQVVKSAARLWLGDGAAADMTDTLADLLAGRVTDAIDQRRLNRMFEGFVVEVAAKARKADNPPFRGLPDNERIAAISAVAETFGFAAFDDDSLFSVDLDARRLEKHLRSQTESRIGSWGLSDRGTGYYNWLLRESCAYLLEIFIALPHFTPLALTEMLRRQNAIERQVAMMLERLPARTSLDGDAGFETDYRRQIAKELDFMDLFGATVFERNRGYPLSVAYISLAVLDPREPLPKLNEKPQRERDPLMIPTRMRRLGALAGDPDALQGVPVDSMLTASRRVFVRGEAGSGKTTLLQWIAVSAARRDFQDAMAPWNDVVPFMIRLRRFADNRPLPQPAQFLDQDVAASLAGEMPDRWVHRLLREGRAVVLVDGVDELPKSRRRDVQIWLRGLVAAFPDARFVVTSRPAAAPFDWLGREEFDACVVAPMALPEVRQFIVHWHEAVLRTVVDRAARDELRELAAVLNDRILARRHLRQLATNPLMCALLCALNRERRTRLPDNRVELFRIALEMFLDRRDIERGLPAGPAVLDYTDKQKLLQDLAYWMMVNSLTDAPRHRVLDRLAERLSTRKHRVEGTSEDVLEYLLERSGLIREPVAGRIDFIHRSFQEFLAAQAAVDGDDIESLVEHAANDLWRQTVVLAAGLASRHQSQELFRGLLESPRRLGRGHQMLMNLTALGCMETASDVDVSVAEEIKRRAAQLIPPRDMETAVNLSRAGEFAFELMSAADIEDRTAAIYSTKLAALLGGPAGLTFIESVARDHTLISSSALVSYWDEFNPAEYADRVLSGRAIRSVNIVDAQLIPGIVRLESIEALGCRCGNAWQDFRFFAQLPNLRHAGIFVGAGHGRIQVALPETAESLLISDTGKWGRPTSAASSDSPIFWAARRGDDRRGAALRIEGLDCRQVVGRLDFGGAVDRLVLG